jgi:ubiquinone/menaquinone biosynthesis C-methylase UbiE
MNKRAYQSMLSEIIQLIPEHSKVLECAAGTGIISIAIASKAGSVLCTDLSLPMLKKARQKAKKQAITNIVFEERDIFHLSDKNETFDAVIAANVIHLLDNPDNAILELWRVTKTKGLLIIPTFLAQGSKASFKILLKFYKLLGFNPKQSFSEEKYKTMFENVSLPKPEIKILEGNVPVGLAVFRKE